MQGYTTSLSREARDNTHFRRVLYTDARIQLVVMSLLPLEDIGEEVHTLDQYIRVEQGEARSVLNGEEQTLLEGSVIIIPAGVSHNISNVSATEPLKLSTVYAPANHPEGTIHKTKAEAQAAEEHH